MFSSALLSFAIVGAITTYANALVIHAPSHEHTSTRRFVSGSWSQSRDHPVNALFKRAPAGTDGASYPAVGSSEWTAKYPSGGNTPDPKSLPQEWIAALNAAVAAGKIPNIPPSTLQNGNLAYPNNMNPNGPEICSSTYQCRSEDDIYDGPDGTFGISFDDGPLPPTTALVDFLEKNNETATHFMIGTNILYNPGQFERIWDYGGDCAVHTWTHPYMTTLSNEQVVGELGWTMQIIHDSTGGRVPKMWRPPYGDSDLRVRAIAREVFGMITVIWNQDTDDWSLTTGGQHSDAIDHDMDRWLTGEYSSSFDLNSCSDSSIPGSKTPGLIVLEHELSDQSVQAFMANYPKVKSNGWETESLARLFGGVSPYQNVNGDQVMPAHIYVSNTTTSASSSSSSSATPTSSAASSSGSSKSSTADSSHSNSASTSWSSLFMASSTFIAVAVSALILS
uniref:chitin deacetylase n=1 Tax=Moniliophthora roreri TaxID=221103 RepID=A0A0W0FJT9_MONRR